MATSATGLIVAYTFLDLNGLTLQANEVLDTTMTLGFAGGDIKENEYAAWLERESAA